MKVYGLEIEQPKAQPAAAKPAEKPVDAAPAQPTPATETPAEPADEKKRGLFGRR